MAGIVEKEARFRFAGQPKAAVPTWFLLAAAQFDFDAVVVFGESGFGELQFELGQNFDGGEDWLGLRADLLGHFDEDAMNLREFLFQEAHELVVLLDRLQRLDENCLAAGAGAVNYALHAALLLHFDRDDEAFAADGNEFVLHRSAFGEATEVSL